ncbi:MAG TPA: hypothetical protein VIK53_08935 [Verrucomicrobiae bacterium]
MAKDQTRIIDAGTLKTDADALAALTAIGDYKPANADLTLTKVTATSDALKETTDAFAQAEAAWQTARDTMVAAQWAFHNAMLGAKQQVVAQYGDDSDEAQAVGLKKKSERAKPSRAKSAATAAK